VTRRKAFRAAVILGTFAIATWIVWIAVHSAVQIKWHLLNPWLIAAALVASTIQECAGTASAQAALSAFGQRAAFVRLLIITTVATAANSIIPAPAGIPARIWLQKTWLGIPVSFSTVAIALEMLCGYGLLALFALAGSLLFGANMLATGVRYLPIVLAIGAIGLLTAWLLREQLKSRVKQLAATRPIPLATLTVVFLNVLVIALATLRLWLILRAVGSDAASVAEITAALCIARVAGVASMIPMGLGSRDVTLAGLLVLAGIPLPIAVLAAAVDRVLSTAPYLGVAAAGWPLLRRSGLSEKTGGTAH
jgi:uncharacterized membrane protein YbhN (UPF0104 family)